MFKSVDALPRASGAQPKRYWSALTKVLSLFVAGIIAPTGFLVYLGIGAIHKEDALLQTESEQRLGKTAEVLGEQAQTVIDEEIARFSRVASSSGNQGIHSALSLLQHDNPGVDRLVLIDANGQMIYPYRQQRAHAATPLPPLVSTLRELSDQAESAEFKDHDFLRAAADYLRLERASDNSRWKAILLANRAGCLTKAKQYEGAEAAYGEILARHREELDSQGLPFGLVVESQLAEVQALKGRGDLAVTHYLKVLQGLQRGQWDVSWDEARFFAQHISERLNSLQNRLGVSDRSRVNAGLSQWDDFMRTGQNARDFVAAQWPSVQRTLRQAHSETQPALILADGTARDGVVYAPLFAEGKGAAVLLARENTDALLTRLKTSLEKFSSASNLSYRLVLRSRILLRSPESPSEKAPWPLHHNLDHIYPHLTIDIAPLSDLPVRRAAERRRQLYLAMVAIAAGVIIIALYATWYAVSREVEVAQLKARFVAGISHELKTPLSIIGLVGQKLQMGRYSSEAEAREYYAMLTEETSRLKTLIDDVLDFSRMLENRQGYRLEKRDLAALAESAVERFRNSSAAAHMAVTFEASGPCWVAADVEALARAFLNLLDNALKYSPPERQRLSVQVSSDDREGHVSISDEGFGIPPAEQSLVFERFYRGDVAATEAPIKGVGLGLSIVQHIVSAHQGRIDLKSEVGKGSMFTIHLPLWKDHA